MSNKWVKITKGLLLLLCPGLPLFFALLLLQSLQLFISYSMMDHLGPSLIAGSIAWAFVLAVPQKMFTSKIWRGIYACMILIISSLLGLLELFLLYR